MMRSMCTARIPGLLREQQLGLGGGVGSLSRLLLFGQELRFDEPPLGTLRRMTSSQLSWERVGRQAHRWVAGVAALVLLHLASNERLLGLGVAFHARSALGQVGRHIVVASKIIGTQSNEISWLRVRDGDGSSHEGTRWKCYCGRKGFF